MPRINKNNYKNLNESIINMNGPQGGINEQRGGGSGGFAPPGGGSPSFGPGAPRPKRPFGGFGGR